MVTQVEFPISALARIFPAMSAEALEALVASIRKVGLLEPIILWRGEVIDGRHRYAACAIAGVERRFVSLADDDDPVAYVLAKNGERRHLDDSQKAVAAYRLSAWSTPGRPADSENCVVLRNFPNQHEAAALLGVSRSMVTFASRIFSEKELGSSGLMPRG